VRKTLAMDRRWTRIRAKNRALLLTLLGLVALFYVVAIARMGNW